MTTALVGWILDATLGGAALALLALLVERLAGRRPALVHAAWTLVLARLALPLPVPSGAPRPAPLELLASDPSVLSLGPVDRSLLWATRTLGAGWSTRLALLLLGVWALLAVRAAAREVRRLLLVRALLARAVPAPPRVQRLIRRLRARIDGGSTRPLRMLVSQEIAGPFVWGGLRPTLVLPRRLARPALPAIVAHELAHLARRDPWLGWLELLAGVVQGWNPLVRLARERARDAAELACDERAVRAAPRARLAYARELVRLATAGGHPPPAGGPAAGARGGDLVRRVARLVADRPPSPTGAPRFALACLVAGPLALAAGLVPPALELLPAYPDVSPADQLLARFGVESWESLLADADLAPERGEAARRRGLALLGLGRARAAADAFAAQEAAGWRPATAAYDQACALCACDELAAAVEALDRAFRLGFAAPEALVRDPDLAPLRGTPRFEELVRRVSAAGGPQVREAGAGLPAPASSLPR